MTDEAWIRIGEQTERNALQAQSALLAKLQRIGSALGYSSEKPRHVLVFRYTNHRGEVADRKVQPYALWFGPSMWHIGEQWHMDGWDIGKQAVRDYAVEQMEF